MKTIRRSAILALVFGALGSQALQQDSKRPGDLRDGAGWSEFIAGMRKMHTAMGSVEPSGNTDVDFVHLMAPHHQAAIDMAKAELLYGSDPQMRRLAQEIITDQQSEIELMQLWVKQHGVQK
jgi:uncharacterized protein (DUF305 family)